MSTNHDDENVNFQSKPIGTADGVSTPLDKGRLSTWFARLGLAKSPHSAPPTLGEKNESGDIVVETKVEETVPVVSFTALLFRFSTKLELLLNVIGLLSAVAAGASQPLMTILFGNLTQSFIRFGTALALAKAGDADAAGLLKQAAAEFRKDSSKNAIWLTYIGLGVLACTSIYMSAWVYTGEKNAKRLREKYLWAVLRQDIAWFDGVGAGEITTRIENDTHLVQLAISEKIPLVVSYISTFVTAFVVAYTRSWRLALALTSIFPWISLTGAIMMKFMTKYSTASTDRAAESSTLAEEVISTVRTAQAFGTQRTLASKYEYYVNQGKEADFMSALFQGTGMGSMFFAVYGCYSLMFWFGTTLINEGLASPSTVVTVGTSILIGSFSMALLGTNVQAMTKGKAAAAKLYATIDRVPSIDSSDPGGLKPENFKGDIVLENVNFSYPSRPTVEVLKNLSIAFPAGKKAALVGPSGSGKSTIISLIERFYDVGAGSEGNGGSIMLDGIDVKALNVKWLRSQIGLVMQEPVLFSTSVRENVAYGLINTPWENASEEKKFLLIKEACVKANADGFVNKLPMGYDTVVGEKGLLLSGGQKQRVAIARAIVSDPRILLLDEATSALDTVSEGVVQEALDKAAAGRTTITIAHRLSTIKDVDQIFVMTGGTVVEHGTHDELLKREDSVYSRLVRAQNLREGGVTDGGDEHEDSANVVSQAKVTGGKLSSGRRPSILEVSGNMTREKEQEEESGGYSAYYLFRRMARINREVRLNFFVGVIFSILMGLVHPSFALIWARSLKGFSAISSQERRREGDRNALWLLIIALAVTILISLQNFSLLKTSANLTSKIRTLSFKALLRQDIKFFDKPEHNTGTLTSNLSQNHTKISGLAGLSLGVIIQSLTTLIAGYALGLAYAWKIALVGVACTPLAVSAGYIHLRIIMFRDKSNKKAHEESARIACEAASSIRTVVALTREDDFCDIYSRSLDGPLRNGTKAAIRGGILYGFSQGMMFWMIGLVFWYGSLLISRGEYGIVQFFVSLMAVTFGSIQVGNAFALIPDIASARRAASDIVDLLDSVPEIDADSTSGKSLDQTCITGRISIENVHFRYPTRPEIPVLRGLSLSIEPGTFIALAGASGSGKSTIIQLIERFYDPWSGQILLDGEVTRDLNVQEYRKQLSLVSQEPTLYAGTIRFNILLGAIKPVEEVTQEEVEAVCRDANILEFILELPNGFDTEVGGKGSQLSGGQKQRIAIARALLRNPKVLLLDEATSALDSKSEKVVQDALDKAAKGRTTIAIAHRLSTIQNADCIYFIKEGRISESGTHDELLARRGDYYNYCQLQNLRGR